MTGAKAVFVVEFESHDGGREILGLFANRNLALKTAFDEAAKKCPEDMEPVAADMADTSIVVDLRFPDGAYTSLYTEAWHVTRHHVLGA